MVAGIAAFIEASAHRPGYVCATARCLREGTGRLEYGLPTTAYDVLRIGSWALVIFGGLLVIVGLIAFARDGRGGSRASP